VTAGLCRFSVPLLLRPLLPQANAVCVLGQAGSGALGEAAARPVCHTTSTTAATSPNRILRGVWRRRHLRRDHRHAGRHCQGGLDFERRDAAVVSVNSGCLLFVAVDIRNTPESPVLKWGFVLLTAYTGVVDAFLYVLGCREPLPGLHERYVAVRWRQLLGSTMHCVVGDGIGILADFLPHRISSDLYSSAQPSR
jgi:hypothetical protein